MTVQTTRQMSVRNGVGTVIHLVTDGRTLCGRDAATLPLNLDAMSAWERIGFEASAKGACQRCASVQDRPRRKLTEAYAAGWNRSQAPDHGWLDDEESRPAVTRLSDAEQDAWVAGWIDYASDYECGTALVEIMERLDAPPSAPVVESAPYLNPSTELDTPQPTPVACMPGWVESAPVV